MQARKFLGNISLLLTFALHMAGQSMVASQGGSQSSTNQSYGAFWEEGIGQDTTLLLRNAGPANRGVANVILYSQEGYQEQVAVVNVDAGSVRRLSLGNFVPITNGSLHWGGLVVESTVPLQGQLVVSDALNGPVRYLPLQAGDGSDTENALQACWWLPGGKGQGLVTLFNSSGQTIVVTPLLVTEGTGGKEQVAGGIVLAPFASAKLDLRQDLLSKSQNTASATMGSLVLRYTGSVHALQPSISIVNPATGFLLQPSFQGKHEKTFVSGATTWQFPAISLTSASRAGAEAGGVVTIYALLDNGTKAPMQPELIAYFGGAGAAKKTQGSKLALPVATLQPGEVRLVNLSQVGQGLIPSGITHMALTVSHAGAPGDLGVTVLTADQTMSEVHTWTGVIRPSTASDISFWDVSVRPAILPMIQNASEEQASVPIQAILYYADAWGIGSYSLPTVTIGGGHKRALGLRSAVLSGIPDDSGNRVPSSAKWGLVTVQTTQIDGNRANASSGAAECSQNTNTPTAVLSSTVQSAFTSSSLAQPLLVARPQGAAAAACSPPPPDPPCPSTITVFSSSVIPLDNGSTDPKRTFPSAKSGLGSVFYLQVGPTTTTKDWAGTKITESFSDIQSGCQSPVPTPCHGSTTFTVGQGSSGAVYGQTIKAQKNIFWDMHLMGGDIDWLGQSGQTDGCTITCTQTYSCNDTAIANFTIKYTLSHGMLSGQAVTNVQSSETPQ